MPKLDNETKDSILAAAERVFHANGFKGSRTTKIAEEANISRTMLHYYYRSKEDLFQAVLNKTMGNVLAAASQIVVSNLKIEEVIEHIIDVIADVFEKNPGLPSFIVNILNESPEIAMFMAYKQNDDLPNKLDELLMKAKKKKIIRKEVTGENLIIDIYSLLSGPYLCQPYIMAKEKRNALEMQAFIKKRNVHIKAMIMAGIKF